MLKNRLADLLNEHMEEQGCDAQSALRDVLTDLRHIAHFSDCDFSMAIEGSQEVEILERLEYLRGEIEAESISLDEVDELQSLADYIDADDVLLLEWAGVEEKL